jgi:GNAT superfamily N-acetyltransferase
MNHPTDICIAHLEDFSGLLPTLEHRFIEEWAPWYGPGGLGNARADLMACNSRAALPICLIALDKDGNLLGTAMLKSDSVGSELGVGPWLAAVLARPERHGKGIGTALVEAIEK